MKLISLLAVLLINCCPAFAQKGAVKVNVKKLNNDTIIWQKDSSLRVDDFKGKVHQGYAGCAVTFIMINPFETNGNLLFSVQAVFMKSKSAIIKTSDYILKHEQLHFDICELYARKLRKTMKETDFTKVKNIQVEIQKMYNKNNLEYEKTERKYDEETNHGENPAKQKVWSDDIINQMKDLEQYGSTEVNIVK